MIRTWRLLLVLLSFESFSQQVIINEFFRPADHNNGWIELANRADSIATLGGFRLIFYNESGAISTLYLEDSLSIDSLGLQTIKIPRSYYQKFDSIHYALLVNSESSLVDSLSLMNGLQENESIGRYPDLYGIFLHSARISPGKLNPEPGPWLKRANKTSFGPRDSSPNACIVFNDTVWVLAGWRNQGEEWFSKSDVYNSGDAINWKLVNDNPPYDPYSGFVSFKNKMWAFHLASFCSTDGKEWTKVESNIQFKPATKFAVFKDILWAVSDKTIWKSMDGINWQTVTEEAPWFPRTLPGFVVCQNKLWFFGGGIGYETWGEDYYLNDVWYSEDGVDWQLVTESANWPGRYWFATQSYNDMLFIFGGWSFFEWASGNNGNLNDVWFSEDGKEWKEWQGTPWPKRHAPFSFVFNNSLWLSSGYGTGGASTLYNDVWQFNGNTYFSKENGNISDLETWNSRIDGKGKAPTSFRNDNSNFFLINRRHSSLDDTLEITGSRSQIIITKGESLSINESSLLKANINLEQESTIEFRTESTPNFYFQHPLSTVIYDFSGSEIRIQQVSFPNLRLKNAHKISFDNDSIVANGSIFFENVKLTEIPSDTIYIKAKKDVVIDSLSNLRNSNISLSLIGEGAQNMINESFTSVDFNFLNTKNKSGEILKFYGDFRIDSIFLEDGKVQLINSKVDFDKMKSDEDGSYFITDSLSRLSTTLEDEEKLVPLGNKNTYSPIYLSIRNINNSESLDTVKVYLVQTDFGNDTLTIAWKVEKPGRQKGIAARVKWSALNEGEDFSGSYKRIVNPYKIDTLFCNDTIAESSREVNGLLDGEGIYTVVASDTCYKSVQQIDIPHTLELTYGDTLHVPLMSSANIPIQYDFPEGALVYLSVGTLLTKGAGQTFFTVRANNNEYYREFQKVIPVTISKKTLDVTIKDIVVPYGTSSNDILFEIDYEGLSNGDDINALSDLLKLDLPSDYLEPGMYPLIPNEALDNNYDFIIHPGTLTIEGNDSDLFKIFPNPATDNVHILSYEVSIPFKITITSPTGRVVYERMCSHYHEVLNLSDLSQGIYMMRCQRRNGTTEVRRIVINR